MIHIVVCFNYGHKNRSKKANSAIFDLFYIVCIGAGPALGARPHASCQFRYSLMSALQISVSETNP